MTQAINQSHLMASINTLQVKVCANRGRNLAPLLLDLWPELKGYDLLLHLHGKRSVETDLGGSWLAQLLSTLLPTSAEVADLLERCALDQSLGLVMPQPPPLMRPYLNWGNNFELARQLASALSTTPLSREAVLLFPAGMMFWCRPKALMPLAALVADLEELPPEPLAVDGTSLHALERLVGHSCESAGLRWRLLCSNPPSATTSTPAELSLWEVKSEDYLQATALLAARARQLSSQLLEEQTERQCAENNLKGCEAQLTQLIGSAQSQLEAAEQQILNLMATVAERDQRLHALQSSLSWRLTKPLRGLSRLLIRRGRSSG